MATTGPKKKSGRPALPNSEKKLPSMGFRPTLDIRQKLEDAAAASGRSMSQEIERRLERSFQEQARQEDIRAAVLDQVYESFGGKGRFHIMHALEKAAMLIEGKTGERFFADRQTANLVKEAWSIIVDSMQRRKQFVNRLDEIGPFTGSDIAKAVSQTIIGTAEEQDWPKTPIDLKNSE